MKKIYLFAAIFAIVAGFATYFFINSLQHNSAVTGVEEANVVVAVQDIEKNTPLTEDMFKVIKIPVSGITYGTVNSVRDIIGYVNVEKINRGEQVLAKKLARLGDEVNIKEDGQYHLSYDLEPGNYAFSISVSPTTSVSNFIRGGDYINIYDAGEMLLENVEVLAVSNYSDNRLQATGTEITAFTEITLKLTAEQLKKLSSYNPEVLDIALVPYVEGIGMAKQFEKISVPEDQNREIVTNRGMGEIGKETTVPVTGE